MQDTNEHQRDQKIDLVFSSGSVNASSAVDSSTQINESSQPANEAEQVKNYLANVANLRSTENKEEKEANALTSALKSIAYASGNFNVFTNEQFQIPQRAYVKGNGGSYPYKLAQLEETAKALKITSAVAWQVAKALKVQA